jgi:hypothetical protein
MFSGYSLITSRCVGVFSIALLGGGLAGGLSAKQIPEQARTQIMQQAALLSTQPAKMVLKSATEEAIVGRKSQVLIELLNADGQPVPAKKDWACQVSFQLPSGNSKSQTVWIKEGQSTAEFEFVPEQAGLTSISVKPPVASVRADKTELIVRPAKRMPRSRVSKRTPSVSPTTQRFGASGEVGTPAGVQFREARFALSPKPFDSGQGPENDGQGAHGSPILHISVNDVGNNYFANGKDAAEISAVFESANLSPAPADIHIWLHWTNGSLDPPPPLLIAKGTFGGKAHLTSASPADVHVNFVSSTPAYQAQGDTDFTVHFVPPGAALVGPDKLSVVDNAAVMLVFFDAQNNPVSPGKDWQVMLRSKQSKLRFTPQSFKVAANLPMGSAVLLPISLGSDTIEAVVANYSPLPLPIVVTGWLVLGLCLGGGVAGGLAAYNKFKGSWFWRIFLGILGGAMLCWLYVYLALPSIDSGIAHNTLSVFFVALLGGYLGITVLDFAAKKLGLNP